MAVQQFFIPEAIFNQVLVVDAAPGAAVSPPTDGSYVAVAGVRAPGILTKLTDTVAPVISGASVTRTNISAALSWSTNEGNGVAFWMVDTNPSRTVAQVMAGIGVASDTAAVAAAGAQPTITANGLTASTAYYFHVVHQDVAGNRSAVSTTAFTTTAAAAPFFTMGVTGPYFVDPSGLPDLTTVIEHEFKFRITEANPGAGKISMVESTSFDMQFYTDNGLRFDICEDSAGAVMVSGTSFAKFMGYGDWKILKIKGDQTAREVTWSLTGFAGGVFPFTAAGGTGKFAPGRKLSIFGSSTGSNLMAAGVQVEYFETYFTTNGVRTLRKRIAGNAATVNADAAWKRGGDAT